MRRLRLQTIVFILLILVTCLPVGLLTLWIQQSAFKYAYEGIRDRHLLLAQNLTGALARYAIDCQAVFVDISDNLETQSISERQALLSTLGIDVIASLSLHGEVVSLHHGAHRKLPQTPLDQLLDMKWRSLDKVSLSGVLAAEDGSPTICLRRQVGQRWMLACLNTNYIVETQRSVTFGELGHAAIVDHRGRLLAHPKEEWRQQMRDLSQLAPVQAMIRGDKGVTDFYSPAVEADMVAGYATELATGWGVMVPQPRAELAAQVQIIQRLSLIVAALGLILAWVLGWYLSRSITRPIQRTVDAARRLADHRSSEPIPAPGRTAARELDTLCVSFNRLTDELEQSHQRLEERVAKRTRELEEEIRRRKMLEDNYRHLATHDELTDLPNRALLMDRLHKALQHGRREHHTTALLFVDLDAFKAINDRLGHIAGDFLLEQTAQRLLACVRQADTVSRFGGDEFVVLLVDAGDRDDIERIASTLLASLSEPLTIYGQSVQVTATIGIVVARDLVSSDALLKQADEAMYRAKKAGKNRYLYTEAISAPS